MTTWWQGNWELSHFCLRNTASLIFVTASAVHIAGVKTVEFYRSQAVDLVFGYIVEIMASISLNV